MVEVTDIATLTGNTVRLTCTVKNFEGEKTDPETIKFLIYNNKYEVLSETILGPGNKDAIGEYFYDYTTEDVKGKYYFEFYSIVSGNAAVQRGTIRTSFVL